LNMNFQQGSINGYGVMCVFRNGTNSRISFFSVQWLQSVI